MILYTQDEVEKYTRMLARAYDAIRNLTGATGATGGIAILKDIERTMGWNVPPPMKAPPPTAAEFFTSNGPFPPNGPRGRDD